MEITKSGLFVQSETEWDFLRGCLSERLHNTCSRSTIQAIIATVMSNDRPHIFIPSPPRDAQQRAVPRSPVSPDYNFKVLPPRPVIDQDMASPSQPQLPPPTLPPRPRIQSVSDHYPTTTSMSFPEPRLRATSYQENPSLPVFLQSRSDNASLNSNNVVISHINPSVTSFASSYAEDDNYDFGSAEVCSSVSSLLLISLNHL